MAEATAERATEPASEPAGPGLARPPVPRVAPSLRVPPVWPRAYRMLSFTLETDSLSLSFSCLNMFKAEAAIASHIMEATSFSNA